MTQIIDSDTEKTNQTIDLEVPDLCCADCAEKVYKALMRESGIEAVRMDLLGGKIAIDVTQADLPAEKLAAIVKKCGYEAAPPMVDGENTNENVGFIRRRKVQILTVVSGAAWVIGFVLTFFGAPEIASQIAFYIAIVAAAAALAPEILGSIRQLSLDMNILMSGAVVGAIFIGELAEGAMVIFLFAVAEMIEAYSLRRANRSIEKLMDLAPDKVRLLMGTEEKSVSPYDVTVGARFLVRPGERIGLDGKIVEGQSRLDQSSVTGEPLPVEKNPGDEVFAGTINLDGALTVESTKIASDSTVARIIRLVREAQASKAPTQRFIDSFAKVYTPIVFAAAVLLTLVPVFVFAQPFSVWFYRSLVMLLIACPCAFIIATPVTIVSGLAAAARAGVLIKGGVAMEKAAKIKAFAFDKTGTLTVGKPKVNRVVPLDGMDETSLLAVAASIEKSAGHPLGDAIVEHALSLDIELGQAKNVKVFPGLGAIGELDGRQVVVGSHKLFHQRELCDERMHAQAEQLAKERNITVFIASDNSATGIVVLSDALRDKAGQAVTMLKNTGIRGVAMLSGDNRQTAEQMAGQAGVDKVFAELMPEQKVEALSEVRSQWGPVAMVGDGINDAPALAASDLGIAMGAGTDQALETADAALISQDLTKLHTLIKLSRKTVGRVKQNIAIALAIKGVFMVLAMTGFATLWMAVFADTGASLIVIANGLRLLNYKD